MKKKWSSYKVLFLFCIFLFGSFSGCFEEEKKRVKEILVSQIEVDQPSILPNWKDGEYHDYDDTMLMLNEFNDNYPD